MPGEFCILDKNGIYTDWEIWKEILHKDEWPDESLVRKGLQIVVTREYNEALHPRDDRGRWTSSAGSTPLETTDYKALDEADREALEDRGIMPGQPLRPEHIAGLDAAMKSLEERHPELAQYMKDHVNVVAVNADPSAYMYTMAAKNNKERQSILVNTSLTPEDIVKIIDADPQFNIAHQYASLKKTPEERVAEVMRVAYIHEAGHVADARSDKRMTREVIKVFVDKFGQLADRPSTSMEAALNDISPYATQNAFEAAAEAFTAIAVGKPLLPELAEIVKRVKSAVRYYKGGPKSWSLENLPPHIREWAERPSDDFIWVP